MQTLRYDVVVIGTGPGGEGAAMTAVKAGKTVAVVERYAKVGGGCTHWGTIPSKALRQAVDRVVEFRSNALFRDIAHGKDFSFQDLLERANRVIRQQVDLRTGFYDRNSVRV